MRTKDGPRMRYEEIRTVQRIGKMTARDKNGNEMKGKKMKVKECQ